MMKLALIVGHTNKRKGAVLSNGLDLSEYEYNKTLANIIQCLSIMQKNAEVKIFLRDGKGIRRTYRQVAAWDADVAIELHFNAYTGPAQGCMTLYGTIPGSARLAKLVQTRMLKSLGSRDRGIKLTLPDDRGGTSVNSGTCPKILVEPFFGSDLEDSVNGLVKISSLAQNILKGALDYMGH